MKNKKQKTSKTKTKQSLLLKVHKIRQIGSQQHNKFFALT